MKTAISPLVRSTTIAAAALLLCSVSASSQHALTSDTPVPAESEGCNLCHGSHGSERGYRSSMLLKSSDVPGLSVQASGVGPVSRSCLRCHSTSSLRAGQVEFRAAPQAVGGGAYLHADLGDDHPIGRFDGVGQSTISGFPSGAGVNATGIAGIPGTGYDGSIECTSCHDPHRRQGALPSPSEEQALCTSCHDPGRYGFGSHTDLPCTSCHGIHGGYGVDLLTEATPDGLCTSCHQQGAAPSMSTVSNPSRRDRLFASESLPPAPPGHVGDQEGSCTDCHAQHE